MMSSRFEHDNVFPTCNVVILFVNRESHSVSLFFPYGPCHFREKFDQLLMTPLTYGQIVLRDRGTYSIRLSMSWFHGDNDFDWPRHVY